ncbi:hypothetical protein [Cytobacillus pseudoceanisediminis]|uniref:hypothetical protein n=1 Tax=Cytobacillus pseudoceanisediminis TaxID=3051614 RepID=UPI003C2EC444
MKKSYSSLNILQKKLTGIADTGIFGTLLSNRKYITVKIPYYEYIRGKVFIEDLRDNFEEQVPFQFDIAVLLYMLFDDFLSQVKQGGANHDQIANYLISSKKRFFKKTTKEKRVLKPLTQHIFEFNTIEDEEEELPAPDERTAYIELRMRESEILRGEVLIHDLEPYLKGISLTIEEMIKIVYLDFIQTIKLEGNSLKVQKSIVKRL